MHVCHLLRFPPCRHDPSPFGICQLFRYHVHEWLVPIVLARLARLVGRPHQQSVKGFVRTRMGLSDFKTWRGLRWCYFPK